MKITGSNGVSDSKVKYVTTQAVPHVKYKKEAEVIPI